MSARGRRAETAYVARKAVTTSATEERLLAALRRRRKERQFRLTLGQLLLVLRIGSKAGVLGIG